MLRTELIRPLPETLTEHAARFGRKIAFADTRRQLSYAELELRTRYIAGHLAGLRVHPGDRAAIYLGNCVETVESYLALTRANVIGVPLNPHSTDSELEFFLSDSGARVVITDAAHLEQLRRVVGHTDHPGIIVVGDARVPAGTVSFETLATTEPEAAARDDLGLDEVAWMLYTSGTTGKPKGVLSTQRNCLWSVAACYVPVPELFADDRVLWPLPLFHSLSHIACVLAVTSVGATARITDGYSADEILSVLREESPTFLAGVPTMYHYLVQAAQRQGVRAPDLRVGLVGGAVTTQSLRASFQETFGVPLLDAYGSTETCGSITINWPTGARVEGSSGLPVPGLNVRLVDPETGRDVPVGEEGEVWVSGPNVMVGYHNRPEETALALQGGWYHTGDLARRDDAGYFTVTGRIKDLIIRGGENIHPGEIEDVLRTVSGVADVAVAGKAHDVLGEVPVAFLVPGPEGLDTDALFAACRERLSYFKVPEELYEVTRIPRTGSGKVTRRLLLDQPARLRAAGSSSYEHLFRTDWLPLPPVGTALPGAPGDTAAPRWVLAGETDAGLVAGLERAGAEVTCGADGLPPADAAPADVVVLPVGSPDADLPGLLSALASRVREWLADGLPSPARLVVLTRNGVRVGPAETPDPAHAAAAGLVRGLQAEYGDRLVHVDLDAAADAGDATPQGLLHALSAGDEPQMAVRAGGIVRPSLERVAVRSGGDVAFGPGRAVVVAGADTAAGAVMARHLVAGHGVRQVVLISEQGEGDLSVAGLAAELTALKAAVSVVACDLTDRAALRDVVAGLRRPLAGVVHAPSGPFRSAVASVAALDEVTAQTEAAALVLLPTAAGPLGMAHEPEDAAVAAYCDAIALRRRAEGRPALSLSLGPWADDADPALPMRTLPAGVGTLSRRELLTMVDAALMSGEPAASPLKLDVMTLHGGSVPAVLRGLIDTSAGVSADAGRAEEFRAEFAALPEAEQLRTLVSAVCAAAADIASGNEDGIAPRRAFKEIGFSSLQAVLLRNRLVELTGLRLPTTLAFDYPTPQAVARFVLGEVSGGTGEQVRAAAGGPVEDDPVVIVGMACRLPGGIASPEDLWTFVEQGLDGVTAFPADRGWDVEGLYDRDPERAGKTYVREGGFLQDATGFDADFFRISPREALAMDPQQRVFLEASWELFERAGVDVTTLHGSSTGVFAGVMNQEYGRNLADSADETEGYQSTGTAASVVSGRVAYTFGFEGPAVTVDTACSSSLVALHLAAQSLRSGECDLALAGGVAVMAQPTSFVEFSRQRGLAPDARCKAFAAAADGTGWSEGVALVLLERLSDARRNGHTVLATVTGSAVNQDGASNGLTAPNGPSQQRVIRQALANARLHPDDIDLVEAHGTGTTLGDPIEAQALINTYGRHHTPDQPLYLGSLKSNIGHTQAAAGVAGIIKTVLALHHGTLPQTLHVDAPTPHVDWTAGTVQLLTESRPWPQTGRPRRAAVSAFGVSGTNAHVILEQAPPEEPTQEQTGQPVEKPAAEPDSTPAVVPWKLSAATPAALADSAQRLLDHLHRHPDLTPVQVATDLARRPDLEHRAVITATHRDDQLRALTALTQHTADPALTTGTPHTTGKTVFVFPGQGTQWTGMGATLLDTHPVFADTITACDTALAPYQDWTVTDVLRRTPHAPTLDRVDVVQPVTFAVMTALARLWQHHGIHPDAVIGHSQGEIAAAHIAGALTLDDAARIIALRSQAIARQLASHGAMMAIPLPHHELTPWTQPHTGHIEIATINGPHTTVVAGDPTAIDTLHTTLTDHGIRARKIPVDYASHTSHVEQLQPELTHLLADITPHTPAIPMYSTTDTTWIDGPHLTGDYWYRNLRQTVHFHTATTTLADTGHHTYIETSPHPVLLPSIEDTLTQHTPHTPTTTLHTLRRNQHEPTTFHQALATLHTHTHHTPTWHLPTTPTNPHTPLPTYPFQHQRYWLKTDGKAMDIGAVGLDRSGHPLLGAVVRLPESDGAVFTNRVSLRTQPWLAEHAVSGTVLVPGTALLELVVRAGDELGAAVVSELVVETPLAVPATGSADLRVSVGDPDESGLRPVTIHSRAGDADAEAAWTRHVTGHLSAVPQPLPLAGPAVWPPAGAEAVAVDDFYAEEQAAGFEFGPLFQGLRAVWVQGDEVFAEVGLPDDADVSTAFLLHPALLDSALHAAAFLPGRRGGDAPVRLPFAWSEVALHATGATALRVHIRPVGADDIAVEVTDPTGAPVASVGRLVTRPVDAGRIGEQGGTADMLFATGWTPLGVDATSPLPESVPGDLLDLTGPGTSPDLPVPRRSRALVTRALEAIQEHLGKPEPGALLVVLTRDARRDPAMASVWGLVRVAQSEHPGQVVLADVDEAAESRRLLPAAVATGEPQLAVHAGAVSVPRLGRFQPAEAGPAPLDTDGTVLVTGGTGTLGGLVARRLVTHHGVRHLLLTSRRGPDAPGAHQLREELSALGATVAVTACDIGDRVAVEELIAGVPAEQPLTAVIHSAAVLDDGVFTSLDPARIDTVFAPKVDGAWNLHLATEDLGLAAFVLFSSASGTLGNAGQGNYAAGNGFLDGLAAYRRQLGLPGLSLAWGLWEQASEMTGALLDGTRGHLKQDVLAMSDEEGLQLFDAALSDAAAPDSPSVLVPVKLSRTALRQSVNPPAVLRDLVPRTRPAARQAAAEAPDSFLDLLRRSTAPEQSKKLLDMVLTHTAATLGHTTAGAVDERQAFKELGFDSLAAVDLRNRIGTTTGLRLPATLVFDYPTPAALARYVGEQLGLDSGEDGSATEALAELHRLEASLDELALEPGDRAEIADRLRKLAAKWHVPATGPGPDLELATDEEILRLAEAELDLP